MMDSTEGRHRGLIGDCVNLAPAYLHKAVLLIYMLDSSQKKSQLQAWYLLGPIPLPALRSTLVEELSGYG